MNEIAETAKIYRDVRVVNSLVGAYAVVGDDCDLSNVVMEDNTELGRRNVVRNLHIGYGSYTERLLEIKWWDLPPAVLTENIHLLHSDLDRDILTELEELHKRCSDV